MKANLHRRRAGKLGSALVAVAAALAVGCHGSAAPAASDTAEEPTVLVRTIAPVRKVMAETLTLYGEVVPEAGASENISFARPVQISRLLVSAGQRVHANQPLLEVETDPTAVATFQQAQAALTLAQKELAAQVQLFSERLTTQAQLAAARKAFADAQSTLAAQQKSGAAAGTQLIRSTREGVVATVSVQQGDRVQPGTSVLQLSRNGAQRVLLGAEPEDVSGLAKGMPVTLSPVFGGKPVAAVVSQVFGVINPQTRLVDVAVQVTDAGQLIAGTKVRGEVSQASVDAWVVPASAVLEDAKGAYLFQIAADHARRVPVAIRVRGDVNLGVSGAIEASQPIVVSGNYELEDGTAVRVATK